MLRAYLKLARIDHAFMVVLAVFTGWLSAVKSYTIDDLFILTLGLLASIFTEIALFTFNDIFNIEEDKINSPYRPIVRGEISRSSAFKLGFLAFSLSLVFSGVIWVIWKNFIQFIVIVTTLIMGLTYNVKVKKILFWGNFFVSFLTALPFIYGALLKSFFIDILIRPFLFFVIAFSATFGREILKGIEDIRGDKIVGVHTFAIVYGVNKSLKILKLPIIIAISGSLCLIPLINNSIELIFYSILISIVDGLFLTSLQIAKENMEKSRKLTLYAMLIGIVSFLIISI